MATFGQTNNTGASSESATNFKEVSKFTLTEAGTVNKLSMYCTTGTTGTFTTVIYADSSGPTTRLAVGAEITIVAADGISWKDSAISPGVALTAGDYWLGFVAKDDFSYYKHIVTGNRKYKAETYSTSPANPFGSVDGTDDLEITIYATYDPAAPSVPADDPPFGFSGRGAGW